MKLTIIGNYPEHAALLRERVTERLPDAVFPDRTDAETLTLRLSLDKTLPKPESFRVTGAEKQWEISAADERGLYFGIGKFLHTAVWTEDALIPTPTNGIIAPHGSFRALYCAMHLYNYYYNAPTEVIARYIDDLLLWGYNSVVSVLPIVNVRSLDDPEYVRSVGRAREIFAHVRKRGMQTGLLLCANQVPLDAPHEFDNEPPVNLTFRGNHGHNYCVSKPGALDALRGLWLAQLGAFSDIGIDCIVTWPYDEGGCGCENCRPWGAKGYPRTCRAMYEAAKTLYPDIRMILSTWVFDVPVDEGEYEGLFSLLSGDLSFTDSLMIDAHREYPRYPLAHPPVKPVVNFPEISMWGLYPWGGFGASALPERFKRIWNDGRKIVTGGMPYTEGIYEDIIKIQFSGYYWDPDRPYEDTFREYIGYEFSPDVYAEVMEIIACIELNHTRIAERKQPDFEAAHRAHRLADTADAKLPERAKAAWRWRILYIRALLDDKRYSVLESSPCDLGWFSGHSADLLIDDPEAQDCFRELRRYYYSSEYNGKNSWTLPPLGGTTTSTY